MCYLKQKNYKEAISTYQKVLTDKTIHGNGSETNQLFAINSMADCYFATGQPEKAQKVLKKVGPGTPIQKYFRVEFRILLLLLALLASALTTLNILEWALCIGAPSSDEKRGPKKCKGLSQADAFAR